MSGREFDIAMKTLAVRTQKSSSGFCQEILEKKRPSLELQYPRKYFLKPEIYEQAVSSLHSDFFVLESVNEFLLSVYNLPQLGQRKTRSLVRTFSLREMI